MNTADVCRKHGILAAAFNKFKAKYGGMDVSDARRLKALEEESAKLPKLHGMVVGTVCWLSLMT